jgi:uncharacterized membrane protein
MPGVTRSTQIRGATASELYEVITDYPAYPGYFKDFTRAVIHNKDGDTWTVEFFAKVVKEISYTLKIVHDPANYMTRWTFVRGALVTDSKGGWTLTEADGAVRVDYEAEIEINAPLPKFVKNRIQDAIINKSIGTMFVSLEQEARRRRGR